MSKELDDAMDELRREMPERFDADGEMVPEFNFEPSDRAEVVKAGDGLAFLRFRDGASGAINEKLTRGAHAPWPIDDVTSWANTWNERGVARWPRAWISVEPTQTVTAEAMHRDANCYGPTLEVMIRESASTWRIYSPSKDLLLAELSKLPPDAPAEIPLPNGRKYRCFGSTLGTFAPIGDDLFKRVDVAETASVVLYGEAVDPD